MQAFFALMQYYLLFYPFPGDFRCKGTTNSPNMQINELGN